MPPTIAITIDGAGNTLTLNNDASISAENATCTAILHWIQYADQSCTISSLNATAVIGAAGANDLVFNYGTVSSGTGTGDRSRKRK